MNTGAGGCRCSLASCNVFYCLLLYCLHNTGRVVDHSLLARSTYTIVKFDNTSVNFGLLNICLLSSKAHLNQGLPPDRKFDFLCLTETWQQPNGISLLNDSTPPGFVCICQPRGSGHGRVLVINYHGNGKDRRCALLPSTHSMCVSTLWGHFYHCCNSLLPP